MSEALITPYLFFGGRLDEALEFYRTAVGCEVVMMMRYSDSPEPPPKGMLPAGFENKVMHATLRIGGAELMASDGTGEPVEFKGFRISLALPTTAAAEAAFSALAADGVVQMPIGKTFWSPCFGMVTDKFGLGWMISVIAEPPA